VKNVYKIVITGPFSAGKTVFIEAVSDIPVVSTERKISHDAPKGKMETTVAMDYGRTVVEGQTLQLFGTPGQPRFKFMWDILSREMDGFVVLVDSAEEDSFSVAKEIIQVFQGFEQVPYVVAANKQDLPDAKSPAIIREALGLDKSVKVARCVATDETIVRQILLEMVRSIT
jgi:small GTP-binding protein